uniref:Fe2OG dioxygenase domain-containing protein n=1 Tax=Leersia perrieri TaxID=77586 RepID=A0A0D9V9Z0_9ORYZ
MDSDTAAVCTEKASEMIIKIGQVDDVQELQRQCSTTVPERYIRDGDDRPAAENADDVLVQERIPVIDVGELQRGGEDELHKLRLACEQWGFFQVVNHGVEKELMGEMEKVAREFFMLPLEEKEKYPMEVGGIQGYGHAFVFSEEQKLDWCNMLALGVEPAFIRRPNLWPTTPPNFSETLEKYSVQIRQLCVQLLDHIAETLQLPSGRFNAMFGEAVQAVRINFYPPCPRPDLVLGLSPHSDGSAVTVLQQDASFAGLQVLRRRDGETAWVGVRPAEGALVVNVGDTLEVLTNGRYKSVEHRAVASGERERMSVVTFYAPAYDVELGPLPEFVDGEGEPCRYRRYNHGEYSRHYVTSRLEGKKTLEFAKI